MNDSSEKHAGCASGCSRCELNLGAVSPAGSLHGWRLSVAAAAVFVLPFILAIAGASLGGGKTGQFVGAIAGLGVGVSAVIVIAAVRRRRRKRFNPPCPLTGPAGEEKV